MGTDVLCGACDVSPSLATLGYKICASRRYDKIVFNNDKYPEKCYHEVFVPRSSEIKLFLSLQDENANFSLLNKSTWIAFVAGGGE